MNELKNSSFIHLRVHTSYSLCQSTIKVSELVNLCKSNNMQAVGVTDLNNLFGGMDVSKSCYLNGIQHLVGVEINFLHEENLKKEISPIIIFAKNKNGYKNLMKIVTNAYKHNDLSLIGPFIKFEILEKFHEDLILLTGGAIGPIGKLILNNENFLAEELLKKFKNSFGSDLYIELMRTNKKYDFTCENEFLNLAEKLDLPIVATNNVFFGKKEMHEAQKILHCISDSKYISNFENEKITKHNYFKTEEEMIELFSDIPEAIENTILISKRISFMIEEVKPILPPFKTESGRSEEDQLDFESRSGLEFRLKNYVYPLHNESEWSSLEKKYSERLDYELSVIIRMGFAGYFLIVSDFIKWSKKNEIPVGPGRGSGAGTLVAWSLLITDVDPIRFGLIFERFLNSERVSLPDFDIDFCQERRDEVVNYVIEKYGIEKIAQIITFGKMQARAVLRDVGRVLQMPYSQVDRISKMVPNNPSAPVTLSEAIKMDKLFDEMADEDDTVKKLIEISLILEGLYRHASTHAAGVVIGGMDLSEMVPLYYDGVSKLAITQYNMKFIESAGLLKFDFLGLKTLSVIKLCSDFVEKRFGKIDIIQISLDDKKTFKLLANVNVLGVFQIESAGMKDALKKMKPDRFEDIIALISLYRPGPIDDIPTYINRKHRTEEIKYLDPRLEDILCNTYGVMVYQEQVMKIAEVIGGYTMGGADILRRAMGKKIKSEMDAQSKIFIDGAIKNGVTEENAEKLFNSMAKFASYGFNKSHATPYALISYQTAYLKANYPIEFYAAITSFELDNIEKLTLFFQDLKENNLKLLSPDINKSFAKFTPEKISNDQTDLENENEFENKFAKKNLDEKNHNLKKNDFLNSTTKNSVKENFNEADFEKNISSENPNYQNCESSKNNVVNNSLEKNLHNVIPEKISNDEYSLRYALAALKNVGINAITEIINEREKNGKFKSIEDFFSRVSSNLINKRQLESLISAGAFDSLHKNRKELFESIEELINYSNYKTKEKMNKNKSLFDDGREENISLKIKKLGTDWNLFEKLEKEFSSLGFFMSGHPLDIYDDLLKNMFLIDSSKFQNYFSELPAKFAAIILSNEERVSKKSGQKFCFLHLSDKFGMFEVPFFSERYLKIRNTIAEGKAVIIEASIKNEDNIIKLTGVSLTSIDEINFEQKSISIYVNESIDLDLLKKILLTEVENINNETEVIMHSTISGKKIKINLGNYKIDILKKSNILNIPGIKLHFN